MNFAINPPSNKINKFSLTILSQKHAHCEPFSSLPFLLFNKYENGLESERESVQINSSGFRFNVWKNPKPEPQNPCSGLIAPA